MGMIVDTNEPELGIELRRTSVRLYDDDGAKTQHIFAHDGLDGKMNSSVEISASQLLRILAYFAKPENLLDLQRRAQTDLDLHGTQDPPRKVE